MKKKFLNIILLPLFLIGFSIYTEAQSDINSQDELKKKANEYFEKQEYSSALPLYSQLVSIYRGDPDYNLKFGICLIYADRRDNTKPIKFLELAASKPDVDVSVYYYLGLAYHNNYRFTEAIKEYNLYKEKASNSKVAKLDVDRQIDICNNAKELLTHFSDLYVLGKTEVVFKDFFRSYNLDRCKGKIIAKPDALKTPIDKKRDPLGLMYYNRETKTAYFSSFGTNDKNGKDIYRSKMLPNGSWDKPENLGPTINTEYDEDYPFMSSDSILYFSSKGRNTIGGYDIFSSKLNPDNIWSEPKNLNYPINTPFDDIMYVPDTTKEYAYFSSSRSSMEGSTTVYKIRIDNRPKVDETLVLDTPSDTTNYLGSAYSETLKYLKEKESLEINATENMFANKSNKAPESIVNTDNAKSNIADDDNKIPDNISNDDILKMADKQAADEQKELEDLKSQKDAAVKFVQNKKNEADEKYKKADSISTKASEITDDNAKQSEIAKANNLKSEAIQLNKESVVATTISDQIDEQIAKKQVEVNDATQYANEIKTAVKSNSADSSIALLNKMIDRMKNEKVDSSKNISPNYANLEYIKAKHAESQNYINQAKQDQEESTSLKYQADGFRTDASNSKKKSVRDQNLQNAADYDKQAKDKQEEADQLLQKSDKLEAEVDSAKNQSNIYVAVANDIKNNVATPTLPKSKSTESAIADNSISNKNTDDIKNNKVENSTLNNKNVEQKNTSSKPLTTTEQTNKTNATVVNTDKKNTVDVNNNSTSNKNITAQNNSSSKPITPVENTNNEQKNTTVQNNISPKPLTQAEQAKKTKIVFSTDSIIKTNNKNIEDIKKHSDNAYTEANDKNAQSIEKLKQSDNLYADASKTANNAEKQKADSIKKESVLFAQQSVILYNIAQNLEKTYNDNIQETIKNNEKAKEINVLIDSNKISEAENKLIVLKENSKSNINTTVANQQFQSELSTELNNKEQEQNAAFKKASKLQSTADSLSGKSKELMQQAENTNDKAKKDELIKQAEQTNTLATTSQKQADIAKEDANKLEIEVGQLRIKTKFTATFASENESNSSSIKNSNVDKIELKKKIDEYNSNNIFNENKIENTTTAISNNENKNSAADLNKPNTEQQKVVQPVNNNSAEQQKVTQQSNENNKTENIKPNQNTNSSANLDKISKTKQIDSLKNADISNTKSYNSNITKINSFKNKNNTSTQITSANQLVKESKYYFDKAKALIKKINDTTSFDRKKNIYNDALSQENTAIQKQSSAIEIYSNPATTIANNTNNNTDNKKAESANTITASNTIKQAKNNSSSNVVSPANTNKTIVQNKTEEIKNAETNNTNSNNSTAITNTDFKGVYINSNDNITVNTDAENLIPLNPKLPDGIIFKVQIAAVNKHVSPETFKGITPITGETTGSGLIRYLAGLFAKFDDANTSKTQIRTMGYKDAFVVAYNNGKRITIAEALALLNSNHNLATTYADLNNKTYISQGNSGNTNTTSASTDVNSYVGLSNPINNIKGLVYTVQVGVYIRPVTSDQLFNITPLYDEKMANGYIRYFSGTFSNIQDAAAAKNSIVAKGVKDAFVVVYYNGKKITMAEAKTLQAENNSSTNTTNTAIINQTNNSVQTNNQQQNNAANTSQISNTGVVFEVQLGAYRNDIPVEIVNQLLDVVNGNSLDHYKSDDGLTIYTSGKFKDFKSASDYKDYIIEKGIKDAFIIAFQNGQKISIAKATELLK